MPKSSPADRASVLIAAVSGRALAESARRADINPLVADFFADTDTRTIAQACCKVTGNIKRGFTWEALERAFATLEAKAPSPIQGIVYGAGFEDRPQLLARIAERWPLLGNDAATVERLKAPDSFFAALKQLDIKHPRTTTSPPPTMAGWLRKRPGGAGGSHVKLAAKVAEANDYYQEFVPGRAVSALFVGNGGGATVLGFSEQWTAPKQNAPFRYAGAVRPAMLAAAIADAMTSIVAELTAAFAIKGLASADFVVGETDPVLLEINPRPGATLDIFDCGDLPLLRLHLESILEQKLPDTLHKLKDAAASAIVYAPEAVCIGKDVIWPAWALDRPSPGERIDKNRPICTVAARASTLEGAKKLIAERISLILAALGGNDNEHKNGCEELAR